MALQSKAAIQSDITTDLADNSTGDISPADIRGVMVDITDSYTHLNDIRTEVLSANPKLQTLVDSATITWDADGGLTAKVTLGGNRTLAFPTNLEEGDMFTIVIVQDGTGSRTLTWNANYYFEGGTSPTLSTGAGDIDTFSFIAVNPGSGIVGINGSANVLPAS